MPRLRSPAPLLPRCPRWCVGLAALVLVLNALPAAADPKVPAWNRLDWAVVPFDPPPMSRRVSGRLVPGVDLYLGSAPRPGLFLHSAAGLRLGLRAGYDRHEGGLRAMLALEFDF